ncbi:MAG TPA: RNA polymerase sigma factor [Sedimentisphaerales bacterium]|nr:RNA polymerase sigma factor [Sedimentisphaerales bacterium]HRS10197.1 RNA polymerase sigma factor [Sedimentisphaerales bacterium]HRV46903.1 RNA polymerase sigma factor [Sedimentisphaerales bacterium]
MSAENKHILLLVQASSGDRNGLGELADLVRHRLYPFVLRITLNHDTTEDVLQDTLLAMLRGVESLRDPDRFWSWMYRIAYTKIQDTFRRRRLQAAAQSSVLRDRRLGDSERDEMDNPLDSRIHDETLEHVALAVEQLKRQHQDVVRLRYYEGLSYTEIASRTQTTVERARVRFHRAKASLRRRLQACWA